MTNAEDAEDEDDIYLNVAEAGHKMMSSSLFSPRHLSWVILEKCLPAETCRDAFERMSKATVQMCLSTTGFGSDAALLGATRLKAAGEPISPNIAIEMVQTYEEHSSHPCLCEHSSRENNIVSYNLPIPVLAATYHSTLYSRTIPIPCNSESSSPIQPRKSTMTMQIFDTATMPGATITTITSTTLPLLVAKYGFGPSSHRLPMGKLRRDCKPALDTRVGREHMAGIFVTMGSSGSSNRLINIGTGREENISAYGNGLHDDRILWRCGLAESGARETRRRQQQRQPRNNMEDTTLLPLPKVSRSRLVSLEGRLSQPLATSLSSLPGTRQSSGIAVLLRTV
ncbi:conserved hypothetical protein [Histoplasma capsulatum H143]|uniref:Uncharacterized protein n=1 Tax=Ajellomyces capsulatus (strain H143) TaxID=544712 RepID=C6HBA9_AJECH|nr:conserved hypothetical protein [Histoplasma capsulatum H143]